MARAANKGLAEAQYLLSLCYESGNGVPVDLVKAYQWALIAIRSGIKDDGSVDNLKAKLDSEQIAAAEKMAEEWQPH